MRYQINEYLKFLKTSTNQHGVHSPFVFKLVTQCFYDKTTYNAYKTIKDYRNQLLKNKQSITVKDFGAGSRVFKTNQRPISKIAKNAGITNKRAQLLYRITNYLKINSILELGTSLGMATASMALANPKASILTIEGCPETASVAKSQFKTFSLHNIDLRIGQFENELEKLQNQTFDLIYIDGNHQKESTLNYFNQLLKHIHNDSILIFDDIHWSSGMTEAWETIKQHEKVTITIDTFFWGMVFFRKEQAKEHFTIRV